MKKPKPKRTPSESSDNNSTPSDTLEKKQRKPMLPWNKVLPGKGFMKRSSGDLPQEDDSISRTSNTSDAAENSGMELGRQGKYQAYNTAVRFIFPNSDTVTLPARSGCSVRDAITPLCEARKLPIQALEIFQSESKELVDLEQELSTLAGAEVVIERRIIFKIELPNHRVIGVKSKPTKKIIEVLRPVTYKYKLMLDSLVVHLSESPVPLDLDITVASLDGQRILIETMEQYSAGTYKPQNGKGRLFKSASMDSIVSNKPLENDVKIKAKQKEDNNNTDTARERTKSTSEQEPNTRRQRRLTKSSSVDVLGDNPPGNPPLAGIKKRGNLRVTGQETEDLIAQLSKANRRMDDQRGLTIKDLELPDFLKKPEQPKKEENANSTERAKTSLGAPYEYEMPEFLKSYEDTRTAEKQAAEFKRPKSTPPTNGFGSNTFAEGSIPTHEEAEALFGTANGSISHMNFDDSMLNYNGRDSNGYGGRPASHMSGVSFHSTTSESSNYGDKFSPRTSYQATLAKVSEQNAHLHWDYSDVKNANMNQSHDADKTIENEDTFLPPPPTPEFNLDNTLELANYSPPPPMAANGISQQQSMPGHHNNNQNNNEPPSGPPSPSTHDLVVSPGSGDQDPSFADGSQQSYSTGSTVTESSVHFGNSSYSGHSTYSSNSSQSRTSSYITPPVYPRSSLTSDPQIREKPQYNRTMTAPAMMSKVNPLRPKYPPPPVKPKPPRPSAERPVNGVAAANHQRGKDRNEMTVIGKDGRKMRASFV